MGLFTSESNVKNVPYSLLPSLMDFVFRGDRYLSYPDGIHEQAGKTFFLFSYRSHDYLQIGLPEFIRNLNEFTNLLP